MKRATLAICAGVIALTAFAQSTNFDLKPPIWQAALTATKDSAAGKAIATEGKGAATSCAGCHGANGLPAAGVPFPRLAGLPVEYVTKQLFDYRDGARANAIMAPIAKTLTDSDIASLARYYASMEVPPIKLAPAVPERGFQLARYGDNNLALPACADCHGSNQTGGGPILPPLAQPAGYTTAQLNAFRTGERGNDVDHVMSAFAKRLSDADIQALAIYFAGP
jgi:cytochrome c553